jgi:hypothetical protein
MVQQLERIDPRILYASLLIIVASAIVTHLTLGRTLSILSMFVIVIVALGNIGYLYRKFKKRP